MSLPKTAAGLALAWLIACVSDRRVGLVMIFGCGSTAAVPAITETKLRWRYSEWHWIDPSVLPVTGGVSERGMVCFCLMAAHFVCQEKFAWECGRL